METPLAAPVVKEILLEGEKITRASTVKSSVIPAGGYFNLEQFGNRFYFINATSGVLVRADQGVQKPYRKGTGEDFEKQNAFFNRLEIYNPNAFNVYVQLWVGFGEYLDTTSELIELFAQYYAVPLTLSQIGAGAHVLLNGNPTGVQLQRKSIQVSNMDLANSLFIMDVDPITNLPVTTGFVVFPLTTIMFPVSGKVAVKNDTASAIVCYISELWYTYTSS